MVRSNFLSLNSLRIHIAEKPGNDLPLIFIHGNSMSSRIWQKQMDDTAFSNHRLIFIDLPGHGDSARSENPEKDYSLPGYGQVLLEVIRQMHLKKYVIIGFSLGGNISLEVLTSLVGCQGLLLSGAVLAEGPASLSQALNSLPPISNIFKAEVNKEEAEKAVRLFFNKVSEEDKEIYLADFLNTDPNSRSFLSKSVGEGRFSNNIDILQKTSIPVAFATGQHDQYLDQRYLCSLPISFWEEKVKLIPDAGHLPQWENPKLFNELLLRFINTVSNLPESRPNHD